MHGYPFETAIQVRWCDCDAFRHVNNAVVASYLEAARAELWRRRFGSTDIMDIPFVIKHLECDFKRPIRLFDDVKVGLRPSNIGSTSFDFDYLIEAGGLAAVTARTIQVCVRPESGRPVRVPVDLREKLTELLREVEFPSA